MTLSYAPVSSPYEVPGQLEGDLDFFAQTNVQQGVDGLAGQLLASAIVGYVDVDGQGHLIKSRAAGGSYFITTDPSGVQNGPWRAWIVGIPGAAPSEARAGTPVPTNSTATPAPAPMLASTTTMTSCASGCAPLASGGCSCSPRSSRTALALGAIALAFLLLSE